MTLETLLARSFVNQWNCIKWFRGAELKPPFLYIAGDYDDVAFIINCWQAEFHKHIPTLQIRRKP